MGTDCQPVNPQGLFTFIDSNPTMIVLEAPCPQVSSGLAWSRDPHHPYFTRLCQFQLRDLTRLADTFVAGVTGPTAWWETLRLDHWNLSLVTSRQAFVRQWDEKCIKNPLAWVDPGYAASWVK